MLFYAPEELNIVSNIGKRYIYVWPCRYEHVSVQIRTNLDMFGNRHNTCPQTKNFNCFGTNCNDYTWTKSTHHYQGQKLHFPYVSLTRYACIFHHDCYCKLYQVRVSLLPSSVSRNVIFFRLARRWYFRCSSYSQKSIDVEFYFYKNSLMGADAPRWQHLPRTLAVYPSSVIVDFVTKYILVSTCEYIICNRQLRVTPDGRSQVTLQSNHIYGPS
jgi:hypothetical protein